jgi:hypothetical protein
LSSSNSVEFGEDLHAGLAVHFGVHALGEQSRGVTLGVTGCSLHHVAELDDHLAVIAIGRSRIGGEQESGGGNGAEK